MATYELKPRLNRLDGVATVIVQGGQEPEFQITPDPARLLATGVTVSDILDAVRRTNLIDSPGLLEENHQLYLGLVNGQVTDSSQIGRIVVKNTAAGIPIRVGDVAAVGPSGETGLYRSHRQRPPGNPVEHQPSARQQHAGRRERSARRRLSASARPFRRASNSNPFTTSRKS